MSTQDNGGPAFPAEEDTEYPSLVVTTKHQGMTLLDYFAAKALGSLIRATAPNGMTFGSSEEGAKNCALYAECAYAMAGAMLKARQS